MKELLRIEGNDNNGDNALVIMVEKINDNIVLKTEAQYDVPNLNVYTDLVKKDELEDRIFEILRLYVSGISNIEFDVEVSKDDDGIEIELESNNFKQSKATIFLSNELNKKTLDLVKDYIEEDKYDE